MKTGLFISTVLLSLGLSSQAGNIDSPYTNSISGKGGVTPPGYVMPLVSNGSLSIHFDTEGMHNLASYAKHTEGVLWEGRRLGPPKDALLSFGHYRQEISVDSVACTCPDSWKQTIEEREAEMICENVYGGSLGVKTETFICPDRDIVAMRKTFTALQALPGSVNYKFKYDLSSDPTRFVMPRRMDFNPSWNEEDKCIDIAWSAYGMIDYSGLISFCCDCPSAVADTTLEDLSLNLSLDIRKGESRSVTFYFLYSDNLEGNDFKAGISEYKNLVRGSTFETLLASHKAVWNERWDRSFVHLPDARIERAYFGGLYQLLSNATKWSFPVGIGPWHGRYFAFDELYCYLAIASCNLLDLSRRVPEFRRKHLDKAVSRTRKTGARYPWEAMENGLEGAPQPYGHWFDHVFQMSHICTTMWTQFEYTNDLDYLKNVAYPVMKECSRFFLLHMCYTHPDGSVTFGKTTDLERLGGAVENPFFSSCGAIWAFEITAKAAQLLGGQDPELCCQFSKAAEGLRKTLPNDGTKYVPYEGCTDNSIAVTSGMYPYPVLSTDDPLEKAAVMHFYNERYSAGNMYAVGKGLCPWYASWIASAMCSYGIPDKSLALLKEASSQVGYFADHYEINEKDVMRNPWFTTAAGNYVNAVNQALLLSRGDSIYVCYSAPEEWADYSFKLPCFGNMVAEVCVKKGKLAQCDISVNDPAFDISPKTLFIPERLLDEKRINPLVRARMSKEAGLFKLDLDTSIIGPDGLKLVKKK